MANCYNLDGIIVTLNKELDQLKCELEAWQAVTFPTKKDGKPYSVMGKNFSGASYVADNYAVQPGEYKIQVCFRTTYCGYQIADINCYEMVRYIKDEKKKQKPGNILPKIDYLEQIYKYDLEDIKDAITSRIKGLQDRIDSLENQIRNAEHAFETFRAEYNKALENLRTNCNVGADEWNKYGNSLYYAIRDTVQR